MKRGIIVFFWFTLVYTVAFSQQQRPYKLSELNKNGIPHLLDNISTPEQWATKKEEIRKA